MTVVGTELCLELPVIGKIRRAYFFTKTYSVTLCLRFHGPNRIGITW